MSKAKFIRRYHGTGYDRNYAYMDYEYRGHEYTVYENLAKGNEPLSWQHKNAQINIDRLIELAEADRKKNNGKEFNIDEIFDILGWEE